MNKERMSYEDYSTIRLLLQREEDKICDECLAAFQFIKPGNKKALTHAYKTRDAALGKLAKIKRQLRQAIAETYKDHSDPEMRAFWGV